MAHPPPKDATELWPDPLNPGKMLKLELSSTATSGFKGVTKATGKMWQARLLIDGELRHVKSSRRKRECAIALAQAKEMLAEEKRVKELCSKWHPRPAAARLEGPFSMPVPALGESNEKAVPMKRDGTFFGLQGAEARQFRALLGGARWPE